CCMFYVYTYGDHRYLLSFPTRRSSDLGEGGFTGITLLLYFLFDLDPAITNILLNIPVFIIGWKLLGRITFIYTLIGTFSVSIFRSEEHTSELQSRENLVCRLLLEKKKK